MPDFKEATCTILHKGKLKYICIVKRTALINSIKYTCIVGGWCKTIAFTLFYITTYNSFAPSPRKRVVLKQQQAYLPSWPHM